MVAEYADILQIGARNMQNYGLLQAVGKQPQPVMLKRGISGTIRELLMCAEYIVSNGNYNVMLCERGIRTYETATRNTFDLNAVPVLKQSSHLPVVADPSHGTGLRELVPAMSRAAVAAGADALILEVHPDPDTAVSDGRQSLTLEEFAELMVSLRRIAAAVDRSIAEPARAEPCRRDGSVQIGPSIQSVTPISLQYSKRSTTCMIIVMKPTPSPRPNRGGRQARRRAGLQGAPEPRRGAHHHRHHRRRRAPDPPTQPSRSWTASKRPCASCSPSSWPAATSARPTR